MLLAVDLFTQEINVIGLESATMVLCNCCDRAIKVGILAMVALQIALIHAKSCHDGVEFTNQEPERHGTL